VLPAHMGYARHRVEVVEGYRIVLPFGGEVRRLAWKVFMSLLLNAPVGVGPTSLTF
jgi:hypothetical protein